MDWRDSGKAVVIGAGAIVLAAGLSGCLGGGSFDAADFPKFSDIPAKPTPPSASIAASEAATLQSMAQELARESARPSPDTSWAEAARARGAAPAPTAAEIDAEAYARAARARATPPPSRK